MKTKDKLPRLTHLQFAILRLLDRNVVSGRNLRAALAREKLKKSGPAFYQIMSRLEAAKLVDGWYEVQRIDGQLVKARHYRITPPGLSALIESKTFYAVTPRS